jgi:hypothetical protein
MLLDAFMTQRQLTARRRPLRAPMNKLNVPARIGIGLALLVEMGCVFGASGARGALGIALGLAGLVAAHVVVYRIESRPASLKSRPPLPPDAA